MVTLVAERMIAVCTNSRIGGAAKQPVLHERCVVLVWLRRLGEAIDHAVMERLKR